MGSGWIEKQNLRFSRLEKILKFVGGVYLTYAAEIMRFYSALAGRRAYTVILVLPIYLDRVQSIKRMNQQYATSIVIVSNKISVPNLQIKTFIILLSKLINIYLTINYLTKNKLECKVRLCSNNTL